MPSTYTSLHYHLVWSTKERRNLIEAAWKRRLHAWLGGAVRAQGGVALAVGGMSDHVHVLAGLKATSCLADVMRVIKSESSEWLHQEPGAELFEWQQGYFAVTVSPSQIDKVRKYVSNQDEHHRKKTFQEELVEFLQMAGIEYDERYLW
jgi:REP element-mobilizing transposase RayT